MRPSWNEYFMEMAVLAATRSTCERRKVGAVMVKDKNVLSTGYNGAPSGLSHCSVTGCERAKQNVPSGQRAEICRGLHAEQNAIIQAARHGVNIDGASIYITNSPCSICAKMLINAGVKQIFCKDGYDDPLAKELLDEAGIDVVYL